MKAKVSIIALIGLVCVIIIGLFVISHKVTNDEKDTMMITHENGTQEKVPVLGYATVTRVRNGKKVETEVKIPNLDTTLPRDDDDNIIITDENFDRAVDTLVHEFFWGDPEYDLSGVELTHTLEAKSECDDAIPTRRLVRFEKNGAFAGAVELVRDNDRWLWESINFTNASLAEGVEFRFDQNNEVPRTEEEARAKLPPDKQHLEYVGTYFPCVDGNPGSGDVMMHIFGYGDDRMLVGAEYDTVFTQRELREQWKKGEEERARVQEMWEKDDMRDEASLPQRIAEAHQKLYSPNFEEREEALSLIDDADTLINTAVGNSDPATRSVALERMAEIDLDAEDLTYASVMESVLQDAQKSSDEREEALTYFGDAIEYAPEMTRAILRRLLTTAPLTARERADVEEMLRESEE